MPSSFLSTSDVARHIGVPAHVLVYALLSGRLKEPARLQGRRCFTSEDLEATRLYFQDKGKRS